MENLEDMGSFQIPKYSPFCATISPVKSVVDITDFTKLDLRVGEIEGAEGVEGSN